MRNLLRSPYSPSGLSTGVRNLFSFVNPGGELVDLIAQQKHLLPMASARREWTIYKARGCDLPRHGPGRKAGREANGAVESSHTRALSLGSPPRGLSLRERNILDS